MVVVVTKEAVVVISPVARAVGVVVWEAVTKLVVVVGELTIVMTVAMEVAVVVVMMLVVAVVVTGACVFPFKSSKLPTWCAETLIPKKNNQ